MYFGTFLKDFDPMLYQEYRYEQYRDDPPITVTTSTPLVPPMRQLVTGHFLPDVATSLDQCPEDNEAVQYCLKRKIPREKFSKLFYIEHAKNITKIAPEKYAAFQSEEPRLVIPFYDDHGQLTEVAMRALRGESLRYINIKMIEDANAIFGLDTVNREKDIYVTEGPLDSLFLENAIAVGGTNMIKVEPLPIPKEQFILVFDNDPRNKDVCKVMAKFVDMGYRMCIWPGDVVEKDINEMILHNKDARAIIEANIYQGLMALVKFGEWRKCEINK